MIPIEELMNIAKLKGITNKGNAERDYLLELVLLSISRNIKDELVFKGGTCLSKFYKLDRFSEDIDFTAVKEPDMGLLLKKIVSDLAAFGVEAEVKSEKHSFNTIMYSIKMKGPLYKGTPQSAASVRIDINLKSSIDLSPVTAKFVSLYPDVPSFSFRIMQEKEIMAEKARAVLTRVRARDVYDIRFLLEKGVEFDKILVAKKLEYYDVKWDKKEFENKLKANEKAWQTELLPLVPNVPDFKETLKIIMKHILQ